MNDLSFDCKLTDLEKSVLIESIQSDIRLKELDYMEQMIDMRTDLNKQQALLKVLVESGTYEDLEYLYEEAEQEQKEEKKGVVGSIVDAIASIFKSIGNALSNLIKGNKNKNPDEEVEVDKEAWEATKSINVNFGPIQKELTVPEPTPANILKAFASLAGIVCAGVGAFKLLGKVKEKVKIKRSEQTAESEKALENEKVITSFLDKAKDKTGWLANGVKEKLQEFGNFIKNCLAKIGIGSGASDDANANNDGNNGNGEPAKTDDKNGSKPESKNLTEDKAKSFLIRDFGQQGAEQLYKQSGGKSWIIAAQDQGITESAILSNYLSLTEDELNNADNVFGVNIRDDVYREHAEYEESLDDVYDFFMNN